MAKKKKPSKDPDIPYIGFNEDLGKLEDIRVELALRQMESLRLYEPLPIAQAFHEDIKPERLVRGSNRAGKTSASAAEVARMVTGQDPYQKLPKQDGRFICVAKDWPSVARYMWRKLGRWGAFRIIRDKETGMWRNFRLWEDKDRAHEAKLSPPLIPERMIANVAWQNKKLYQPRQVVLKNGWELWFYSSEGVPPQGIDVHGVWFDEEIEGELWYPEMAARLVDQDGIFIWSACPQAATEHLFELHARAEDQEEGKYVGEHIMLLSDNPHLSDSAKLALERKLTPQERRTRIEGEFALTGYRVFPEYDPSLHRCPLEQPPADWTFYASIDPGRQVCAVAFVAVGPPNDKGVSPFFLYDELYIRQCNAVLFAKEFAAKAEGKTFEAFMIDHQGARVTEMVQGLNVEQQYSEQLKAKGISSRRTGPGFAWSTTDQKARNESFRHLLYLQPDNSVVFWVPKNGLRNFEHEVKHYHYKRHQQAAMPSDEVVKKNDHLMDAVAGLAHYRPRYVPHAVAVVENEAVAFLKKIETEFGSGKKQTSISLGPQMGVGA